MIGLVALLWAIQGCAPAPECADDADCGEREACLGGTCFRVECSSSAHCPIEQRCSEGNRCVPGCADRGDCYAGFACESGRCVEPACTRTELHCSLGEVCDLELGECRDTDWDLCGVCGVDQDCGADQSCSRAESGSCEGSEDCAEGWDCETRRTADLPCIADDNCPDGSRCVDSVCQESRCVRGFCLPRCDLASPEACPGGFQCSEGRGGSPDLCYGDCEYYLEAGYL